jgi:hypothetical protein
MLVGQAEAALQPAEHPPLRRIADRHQADDRLAGAGNDGLAARYSTATRSARTVPVQRKPRRNARVRTAKGGPEALSRS